MRLDCEAPTLREQVLIPLLASRSCHLPGNTWSQDWIQWFRNNHILFGICLHHPLHPLEAWERCLLLAASVSFGLVATNLHLIYEYRFIVPLDEQAEDLISNFSFSYGGRTIAPEMIFLWIVGGLSHSIFDLTTWHIMACACCHPGGRWGNNDKSKRYKDCGSYALVPLILALLGFAIFLVLLRATQAEDAGDGEEESTSAMYTIAIQDWRSFEFLSQYAIEMGLAWFVCFPMVGTIVFSGILGCGGRLPVLGGRPRDVQRVEEGKYGLFNQSQYTRF